MSDKAKSGYTTDPRPNSTGSPPLPEAQCSVNLPAQPDVKDRATLLRRHYWIEITRMRAEIKAMESKLAMLDEMDKLKLDSPNARTEPRREGKL